jgi:hypothetical protein
LEKFFDQIGQSILARISFELKIDLKVVGVSIQKGANHATTRMAKLRIVERFIEKNHDIGTIEHPGRQFFRGRLNMQWGWLASDPSVSDLPIVFFRGEYDGQLVLLFGSRRHVLGESPDRSANAPAWSALPNIMATISEHISETSDYADFVRGVREGRISAASEEGAAVFDGPIAGLSAAAELGLTTPLQRLEFLAQPLVEDTFSHLSVQSVKTVDPQRYELDVKRRELTNVHAVLGTPLYVAHAS